MVPAGVRDNLVDQFTADPKHDNILGAGQGVFTE